MKYKALFFLTFVITQFGYGQVQNCPDCYKNPCDANPPLSNCTEEYEPSISKAINKRISSYNFHYTLRKIHEPSTVSSFSNWNIYNLGYQKKNFVLDGDLNTPIAIQGPQKFGLNTLHIIPRFKFRIFQNDENFPFGNNGDQSLPVRTPSAMPGIAYYWSSFNWWTQKANNLLRNKYLGLYVYHHSNGQDGIELDSVNIGEINTYNGNFGENLVFEFIIGGKIEEFIIGSNNILASTQILCSEKEYQKFEEYKFGKKITRKTGLKQELYWRVSYEYHPKYFTNSVFDSLDTYGRHRLNINISYLRFFKLWEFIGGENQWCALDEEKNYEKWRHTLNISYILDKNYNRGNFIKPENVTYSNLKRRLNISYSIYYVLGKSQYSALFAQIGYFGTDNYNIYFNNSYATFRIGFAFGFFDQPNSANLIKP
jgi:hypothetical protein